MSYRWWWSVPSRCDRCGSRQYAAAVVRRSGPVQRDLTRVHRRAGKVLRHVRSLSEDLRRTAVAQDFDRADLWIVRATVRELMFS